MGVFESIKPNNFSHLTEVLVAGLMFAMLPAGAAWATTWKCTTAEGGVAYVNNHHADYRDCEKLEIPGAVNVSSRPEPAPAGTWQYDQSRASEPAPALPPGVDPADSGTRVVKGAVYRVERADGVAEYTNVRPGSGDGSVSLLFHYIATCRACDVHSSVDWASVPLILDKYSTQIRAAALDFGVDAGLLRALIHAESGFDPLAVSGKGAQGLTQLMPATAKSLGVTDAFDPTQNIRGGARYLAGLLEQFHGSEKLATAAYNAGPGAVRKYAGVPPYPETQVYVDRVHVLAERYRGAAGSGASGAAVSAAN